jgi:hypothetical protein
MVHLPLSAAFEEAYDELLALLGHHHAKLPDLVCCHWPTYQPSYAGDLLVVGQALNGWVVEAAPSTWRDAGFRRATLAEARRYGESPNAFLWMSPRVRSRPFWRLVDIVLSRANLRLEQIAWSNLAKVAPAAGRNPGRELLWSQHRLGGEVLRREIEELSPRLVLVISGRGYAEPFLSAAGIRPQWHAGFGLQFAGPIEGRDWIVVGHPGTFASRYAASADALSGALDRLRT